MPAGTFTMGSPTGELGRGSDETQHEVELTRSFFLQQTELTQGQWRGLMGNNPSYFSSCGDECPVEQVSWWEAVAYANALSASEGLLECYTLTGCAGTAGTDLVCSGVTVTTAGGNPYNCEGYRLPTESEWEYAVRAEDERATYNGELTATDCTDETLPEIAWFRGNADSTTHRVGSTEFGANDWGLHDMLGNVWEWTWDWYGSYPGAVTDPTGATGGSVRVFRGGSWVSHAQNVRAADRYRVDPGGRIGFIGLRLARTAP